ncbi:Glutaminyl-peptide cyclotransferase [Sarcoptes scabiei]|uniref:glutaminyl-peptide cyclotransferase n=1 Tax=Sarcoptes scabiei TaxID=52283 RepID=A0A834RFE3_SARSC|nr:Glutaminyl-peptide cyclotransferase [Sarcoptes scabiei]
MGKFAQKIVRFFLIIMLLVDLATNLIETKQQVTKRKSSLKSEAKTYIKTSLRSIDSNWNIEEDSFHEQTSIGRVKFRNIIGTYLPKKFGCQKSTTPLRRLVLACHYDSLSSSLIEPRSYNRNKFNEIFAHRNRSKNVDDDDDLEQKFLGATDAAVSCSMLIYLAKRLQRQLHQYWFNRTNPLGDRSLQTLQFIFFDGEEPLSLSSRSRKTNLFKREHNSLYGSRHLASKWYRNARFLNENRYRNHSDSVWISHDDGLVRKKIHSNRKKEIILICDDEKYQSLLRRNKTPNSFSRSSSPKMKKSSNNPHQREYRLESLSLNPQTLDRIKLFLLLDLIGGTNFRFYNTNLNTTSYFHRLISIGKIEIWHKLSDPINSIDLWQIYFLKIKVSFDTLVCFALFFLEKNLIKQTKSIDGGAQTFSIRQKLRIFQERPALMISLVQDDHLPFLIRNVPVMHLIPHPFPRHLARILESFLLEQFL